MLELYRAETLQVTVATGFELLMQNIWHGLHFSSDNKRITISRKLHSM
jgi:hypothetical protein